jgi:hypothetical protein
MLLLEFNRKDKELIKSIGEIFTISLEFELETDDTEGAGEETEDGRIPVNPNRYLEIARENSNEYITVTKGTRHNDTEELLSLVEEILTQLQLTGDEDDDDYNLEIFEEYLDMYEEGSFENDLIKSLHADYLTYWSSDNIDYLSGKVEEHMPNFFKKWWELLKFELDNTLRRGIEFSLLTYVNGIERAVELIDDFYSDFENQNYWYMSERTGIHINIGIDQKVDWNILKGYLMISDEGQQSFTFKDMEWREKSMYTKTFLPQLKKDIESDRNKISKHSQFQDLKKLEKFFGDYILKRLEKHGYKNYGFNITRIQSYNYVEFRYPGGEISKNVLIDKLYYFCYVVYLMTNENYKRREYLKKLYKFISNI